MKLPRLPLTLWAGLAAFGTYFCAYGLRKPFTATDYAGAELLPGGIDFKVGLVIAQVLGYALSKFIGIRLISELRPGRRTALLLWLVAVAELALIGFGLVGDHWLALPMLFLNGLPLGLIWGIVFSYLEGRRTTDLLGAMLAASFIVSSGAVKSLGSWLLIDWSVSPYWMPALTGALCLLPLVGCALALRKLPPPSAADVRARLPRPPMGPAARRRLVTNLGVGLIGIVVFYVLLTALRDVRDNFAAELWTALGYGGAPAVFTLSELPIAVLSLLPLLVGYRLRSNRRALRYYHVVLLASMLLVLVATAAFTAGRLGGAYWMVAVGLGLYLGYVPLNAVYFDRLIAAFRQVANAGFLIYVADASGYGASILVLLAKSIGSGPADWLPFFTGLCWGVGVLGLLTAALSWYALERKLPARRAGHLMNA